MFLDRVSGLGPSIESKDNCSSVLIDCILTVSGGARSCTVFDLSLAASFVAFHRVLRRLLVESASAILLVSAGLAYASPPDAIWISGIYDESDYDDVVVMVTDATGTNDSQGTQLMERVLAGSVLATASERARNPIAFRPTIRGPPVEARVTPIDPLLTSRGNSPAPVEDLLVACLPLHGSRRAPRSCLPVLRGPRGPAASSPRAGEVDSGGPSTRRDRPDLQSLGGTVRPLRLGQGERARGPPRAGAWMKCSSEATGQAWLARCSSNETCLSLLRRSATKTQWSWFAEAQHGERDRTQRKGPSCSEWERY